MKIYLTLARTTLVSSSSYANDMCALAFHGDEKVDAKVLEIVRTNLVDSKVSWKSGSGASHRALKSGAVTLQTDARDAERTSSHENRNTRLISRRPDRDCNRQSRYNRTMKKHAANHLHLIIGLLLLTTPMVATVAKQANAKVKESVKSKNVLGHELKPVGAESPTGFYRDGFCNTGPDDTGVHVVAATMTKEFLEYSKRKGNDLMTPIPGSKFQGLKPGDKWCLCAARWKEAYDAGVAPKVILEATHERALDFMTIDALKSK